MTISHKRYTALLAFVVVDVILIFGFGHRGVHAFRSLLLPGAGLYNHAYLWLGIFFTVVAFSATIAWLQWGTDVILVMVVLASVVTSAILSSSQHNAIDVQVSAHEFPLIVIVAGAASWVRMMFGKRGSIRRHHLSSDIGFQNLNSLPPVERCQAVSVARLAGVEVSYVQDDIVKRAQRINFWSRGHMGSHPFFQYHASARTAQVLSSPGNPDERQSFIQECKNSSSGVILSEPTWCRLLDGTLTAIALKRLGEHQPLALWQSYMTDHFYVQRHHRPTAVWAPLAIRMTHASPWEHAAAMALAYAEGITNEQDWEMLKKSALGAAARGAKNPHDQRLVAAGRIFARAVHDDLSLRILNKPTLGSDPLAHALHVYANSMNSHAVGEPS